jgi:hypothetical protein
MNNRQQAYLDLLTHGLAAIINLARRGEVELCEVEAEHLHNLPSLVDEPNEHRHRYYIEQERGRYLERLKKLAAREHLEFMVIWYTQPWQVLADGAGIELLG